RSDDVRIGLSDERGHVQPNLAWTRNDTFGSNGTYNLTLSASHANLHTDTATHTIFTDLATGQPDLAQHLASHQHDDRNSFHLSPRVQWPLGRGDQTSLQPFIVLSHPGTQIAGALDQSIGSTPAPYATSQSNGDSSSQLGRLLMQLRKRLDEG